MYYFRIIPNGYDKIGGVLFAPKNWPHPIARDGYEVENWTSLIVELRDGEYRHFNQCVGGANIVTEEFKNLLLCSSGYVIPMSVMADMLYLLSANNEKRSNRDSEMIRFGDIH